MPQGLLCQFMGTKYAIQAVREQFGDDLHPGDVFWDVGAGSGSVAGSRPMKRVRPRVAAA